MRDGHNNGRQTGGDRRTWLFDSAEVEAGMIPSIQEKLIHNDEYFFEDPQENTLAKVMDRILDDLPDHLADAVRLVHLRGKSLRAAAKIIGVDHKTVKARVEKGVELMRKRLTDSVWIAEMLRGYIPRDEVTEKPIQGNGKVVDVLKSMRDNDE